MDTSGWTELHILMFRHQENNCTTKYEWSILDKKLIIHIYICIEGSLCCHTTKECNIIENHHKCYAYQDIWCQYRSHTRVHQSNGATAQSNGEVNSQYAICDLTYLQCNCSVSDRTNRKLRIVSLKFFILA